MDEKQKSFYKNVPGLGKREIKVDAKFANYL